MELDDNILEKIESLCLAGDELSDNSDYKNALPLYREAFELVPNPKYDWETSTWILTAILDVYFLSEEYEAAWEVADYLTHCPNAIGNPFIHMRIGQVAFERGDLKRSADELTRAYMSDGLDMFSEENDKYIIFLKDQIGIKNA